MYLFTNMKNKCLNIFQNTINSKTIRNRKSDVTFNTFDLNSETAFFLTLLVVFAHIIHCFREFSLAALRQPISLIGFIPESRRPLGTCDCSHVSMI
jgi:hypothetical protein